MTDFNSSTAANREKLMEDLKVLSSDVQELLSATASVVGDKAAEARSKVEESLKAAQAKLSEVQDTIKARTEDTAAQTHEYVQSNPWRAVGIAAGTGFLLGLSFAAKIFSRGK